MSTPQGADFVTMNSWGLSAAAVDVLAKVGSSIADGDNIGRHHLDAVCAALPAVGRDRVWQELPAIAAAPIGDRLSLYASKIAAPSGADAAAAYDVLSRYREVGVSDAIEAKGDARADVAARQRAGDAPRDISKMSHKPHNDGSLRDSLGRQFRDASAPRNLNQLASNAADRLDRSANALRARSTGEFDSDLRSAVADAFDLERSVDTSKEFFGGEDETAHSILTGQET